VRVPFLRVVRAAHDVIGCVVRAENDTRSRMSRVILRARDDENRFSILNVYHNVYITRIFEIVVVMFLGQVLTKRVRVFPQHETRA